MSKDGNFKEFFEIERIDDKNWDDKTNQQLYRVKWLGYPDDQSTWEPKESFKLAPQLLNDFNKNFQKKKSKNQKNDLKIKTKTTLSKKSSVLNQIDISSLYGNISVDIPKKIIGIKKENNELTCLIEWESTKDVKKLNSIVKHQILRESFPLILLSFYEERVKFKH